MKQNRLLYYSYYPLVFLLFTSFSLINLNKDKREPEGINIEKDFSVESKGVLKKSEKAAIAKVSLHFKTMSARYDYAGRNQDRTTIKTYAILEGISDSTLQSIADEFRKKLNQKIKTTGISTVDWQAVNSSVAYKKMEEKKLESFWQSKDVGYADVITAENGYHTKQIVGNPGIWKTYAELGKELECNAITLDIIIDFAHFITDFDRSRGYSYTTIEASANLKPTIKILQNSGLVGFDAMQTQFAMIGKYGEATLININRDFSFQSEFANDIKSYSGKVPAKMQRRIGFGDSMTTGTFVVQADESKYKMAVNAALEQYLEALVQTINLTRK